MRGRVTARDGARFAGDVARVVHPGGTQPRPHRRRRSVDQGGALVAHSVPPSSGRSTGTDESSIGTLVQSAMADVSVLIRNEIELAKAEIGRSAKKAGIGVAAFSAAGVLLAFAGIYFFVFVAELLALWLPQWAAFLIVTAALGAAAGLAALVGLRLVKKVEKPE